MGFLIPAAIGAAGSIIGGNAAAKKENEAANTALTGYHYLSSNPLIGQAQSNASTALGGLQGTTGAINSLLTSPSQDNPGFKNYLNSTGYNFQLGQGTAAITGSAAAKGLLNSGATARALEGYGQGLAGQYFGNYLSQLGGLANLQSGQVGQGVGAAEAVGQAGTTGGANAGQFQAQAGQSIGSSIAQGANYFGGGLQSGFNTGALGNFFGGFGGGGIPTPTIPNTTVSVTNPFANVRPFGG